ncbi:hypothetical protein [Desulfobulbus alkaliphilus]|uniref:hypothetical protein n=1 Tax=Desulfobulbus alkaliphilus TaxID=869814 RepID=UPI0019661836|nr:hypothetical protein [Desulfobulbus alkaliphilus]MBM9537835.1 hypothetical protein [Desulfobulbus alkaliphilus]
MGYGPRGLLETPQLEDYTRGVEKSVFMAALHPYGEALVGDNSVAPGAEQGHFFIWARRILGITTR